MDRAEVRYILRAYRPGDADASDSHFSEALREVAEDPELSRWWEEEQIFDQAISDKVQRMPVSPGLRARLLQNRRASVPVGNGWSRRIALLAAMLALLAVPFGFWRSRSRSAGSLADYRDEMVSFVRIVPSLDFETREMPELLAHLASSGARTDLAIPAKLRELKPIGCRSLRFRNRDVMLICFKRPDGRRAHLFVMKDGAVPGLPAMSKQHYAAAGAWMTASWSEGGQTYLLALEGDEPALQKYFTI